MGYAVGDTIITPGPLMTVFTNPGLGANTWVKPTSPSARFHRVRIWGPGGAGGGTSGTPGAGTQAEGGGGRGGDFVEKWYLDSSLLANEPYFVGTGGTGVPGGNGNAGTAATTFKGLSAGPGTGGSLMANGNTDAGAPGGSGAGAPVGGDLNLAGGDGGHGRRQGTFVHLHNFGGPCPNGGALKRFPSLSVGNGATGNFPGGGGSGAYGANTVQTGGSGADGKLEIVSFY